MDEVDVEQWQGRQHDQAGNTEVYQQDVSGVSESAISKLNMSDCQIVRLYSMLIIDRRGVKQYVMLYG